MADDNTVVEGPCPAGTRPREPISILFGQERFSEQFAWSDVLDFFPPGLRDQVNVEAVRPEGMLRRLGSASSVDVLVPIMAPVPRAAFTPRPPRLIQQFGSGVERIDLHAARDHGVPVANMTGLNADSVAEHAVMLTLALLRQLPAARDGFYPGRWGTPTARSLAGSTVCVIGAGHIGRAVARRLAGFDVALRLVHRTPLDDLDIARLPAGARLVSHDRLNDGLDQADIAILAASHRPGRPPLIGRSQLLQLRQPAYLVNVARGALLDHQAAIVALQQGHLAGLGLDVFPEEPYPKDGPLLNHPGIIATAHTAALTAQFFHKAADRLGQAVSRLLLGEAPDGLVT